MYNIKKGYGCGIKAMLLTPAGVACDLRKARYIGAVLILPDGTTQVCEDLSADRATNTVYVKLLGDRELTNIGQYGIIFNIKLGDNTMYATPIVHFVEVAEVAEANYRDIVLALSITVVDFPANVAYTGSSPKISSRYTWLVYDDEKQAYIDTGTSVSFADNPILPPTKLSELTNDVGYVTGESIDGIQTQLNTLVNGDVNGVIDAFNEIETFLAGITDAQTLTGMLADLRREVVAQIPTKAATPTTSGLMSAADKTKLDGLSASGGGMKPLVVEVLPVGGVIGGGRAYYSTSNSSYAVTGRVEFPDDADMSTITVPANISVTFNYMFKAQKEMSTVSGTSSQYKQYTIQRVPMPGGGARSYIYLVNCSIYG